MPSIDVPFLGTLVLCAILVSAAYTIAMSVGAGRGRPQLLISARYGTYATVALIAVATLVLAYAFQTHDFRIRYVARYSDRSMSWWYLVTSLWGGQDGSLLWWSFLLGGWTVACTRWMRGRYIELQPWVLATLMSILMFFIVLMLFAANPFATTPASTPPDGEGLNPLLQNYWMTIHPPTLYMGFIGWSIPFAFCIAALITGRLHDEWITASRKWMLASWLFLSVGLVLGMIWSYEELGWGGYWAWDPVENASFMPWLVGTAFLHSIIIQERYGMLKVWNVFLMCLTFFMTIFGTFLTRAGLIASVHSFARSDIGIYFVGFMVVLIVGCFVLIGWRLPKLKAVHRIESLVSREFSFLLNNWILLFMMAIVLALTTYPLVSELVKGEETTVGPPVYNRFMVPFGIVLLVLAGVGPLIAWRKATGKNLLKAFAIPTAVGVGAGLVHIVLGAWLGFPPYVDSQPIYDTTTGDVLRVIFGISPVLGSTSCAFVFASVSQEYWRGVRVRMKNKDEGALLALINLVARAKRRYGGYIVHVSIVLMFIGFTGSCYDVERERTLMPGEELVVGYCQPIDGIETVPVAEREAYEDANCETGLLRTRYRVRYDRVGTEEDPNKQILFTELSLLDESGAVIGTSRPAKFIYRTHPDMPTTEVSIRPRPIEDVYVILSRVESGRATFRVMVRPLIVWIWFGTLVLIIGTVIGMLPSVRELIASADQRERGGNKGGRSSGGGSGGTAALVLLLAASSALGIGGWASPASAQDSSSLHAGTVIINDPTERLLFERLLCMCGDCQRLSLANCACGWAEERRAVIRARLADGASVNEIQESYRAELGNRAISIPSDSGLDRALWVVPIVGGLLAVIGVVLLGFRWRRRGDDQAAGSNRAESASAQPSATKPSASEPQPNEPEAGEPVSHEPDPTKGSYDSRIDDELERLEDE